MSTSAPKRTADRLDPAEPPAVLVRGADPPEPPAVLAMWTSPPSEPAAPRARQASGASWPGAHSVWRIGRIGPAMAFHAGPIHRVSLEVRSGLNALRHP